MRGRRSCARSDPGERLYLSTRDAKIPHRTCEDHNPGRPRERIRDLCDVGGVVAIVGVLLVDQRLLRWVRVSRAGGVVLVHGDDSSEVGGCREEREAKCRRKMVAIPKEDQLPRDRCF